jgi:hypothetical protein
MVLYCFSSCHNSSMIAVMVLYCFSNKQTNKQILYYPQTLYSIQGVKTLNKYIEIDESS